MELTQRWIEVSEIPATAPLYGSAKWIEAHRQVAHNPIQVWGVFENNQLVAWLPIQIVKRAFLIRWLPFHIDTIGGPYFNFKANLSFDEINRRKRAIQTELLTHIQTLAHFIDLYPINIDPRVLPSSWKQSLRATVKHNLSSTLNLGDQAKSKLRRATNKGLSCHKTNSPIRLREALETVQNKHKIGNATLSTNQFLALHQDLQSQGLLETWCVLNKDQQEIAYALVALDTTQKTLRVWYPLNTPEAYLCNAADFITHHLHAVYKDEFEWLDLCGADLFPLTEFKEKWASETQWNFAIHYSRSPFHTFALQLFSKLKKAANFWTAKVKF